ncbi:unnamed protein product, partial [Vitis vinifera]|uniref:Uncharacterized protein n=1 Tax=Vitis vinifera TaxID=29760 RepID=D7SYN1_VITVI
MHPTQSRAWKRSDPIAKFNLYTKYVTIELLSLTSEKLDKYILPLFTNGRLQDHNFNT